MFQNYGWDSGKDPADQKLDARPVSYTHLDVYKRQVVIGIVVSVLANVQGTMFMKTLIDQYIMPMLQSETPDFHPLAMAILRVACFYAIGVACTYTYNRLMIYRCV